MASTKQATGLVTLALIFPALVAGGCTKVIRSIGSGVGEMEGKRVIGTGKVTSEKRSVGNVNELEIQHAIQADVKVGATPSLIIEAQPNIISLVKSETSGDRVIVKLDDEVMLTEPIKVHITVAHLDVIEASGASTVTVTGVDSHNFHATASGATHLQVDGSLGKVRLVASGASKVTVNGKLTDLDCEATGASQIFSQVMEANEFRASASGASTISVGPVKQLDAEASGASTILYRGTPAVVKSDASGASTIRQR
jgi:Putative auto-transporter adhesin, head GIN domain